MYTPTNNYHQSKSVLNVKLLIFSVIIYVKKLFPITLKLFLKDDSIAIQLTSVDT